MNDEEMVSQDETEENLQESDPISSQISESSERLGDGTEPTDLTERPCGTDMEIPADTLQNPDPSAPPSLGTDTESRLDELRSELMRLRSELHERDKLLGRIGGECEEFRRLYPETPLSDLPDGVWEDVRHGVPVAAAWALAERRRLLTEQKASEYNLTNSRRSAGALSGVESEYFSPAEVRAMSQSEVRENYQKIMRSMQKWK